MRRSSTRLAGALLAPLLASPCGNAIGAGPPAALTACMAIKDDALRLACYDRELARMTALAAHSFGLSPAQEQQRETGMPTTKPAPAVLKSTLRSIELRADHRAVMMLADGATWLQGDVADYVALRPGDAVEIRPGLLGSYYLTQPSGAAIRVTRIR